MIYCDSSLIVALVTNEIHSDAAMRWLRAQTVEALAASAWVGTEVASALALKHRLGVLDNTAHNAAARAATRLLAAMTSIEIERRHFVVAGERMIAAPPNGLRAGDALHLAIVVDRGWDLATLDRQMHEAAQHMGLDSTLPGST